MRSACVLYVVRRESNRTGEHEVGGERVLHVIERDKYWDRKSRNRKRVSCLS